MKLLCNGGDDNSISLYACKWLMLEDIKSGRDKITRWQNLKQLKASRQNRRAKAKHGALFFWNQKVLSVFGNQMVLLIFFISIL